MSPDPVYSDKVKAAMKAALTDIHLLRLLARSASADDANVILKTYRPSLVLTGDDLTTFDARLRTGKVTMTVQDLIDHYDNLNLNAGIWKGTPPPPKEWNP